MADRDPHGLALQAAARGLGLAACDRSDEFPPDAVEYAAPAGGPSLLVLKGRVFPWLHAVAERTLDDKAWTKRRLEELSIPTPAGRTFSDPADVAFPAGRPQVCKPVRGSHGVGVAIGLTSAAELRAHCAEHPAPAWILEDLVEGGDLRLQALRGRLVAACVRSPARVEGDGAATLAELMARRDEAVQALNPRNRCLPDADTARALAGRPLTDVPARGEVVAVKTVANLSAGGAVVDVTDDLHPTWARWVEALAAALDLPFFAMDAITPDPAADPLAAGAAVLEANARPEWLHHTFSEQRTHDLQRQILLAGMAFVGGHATDGGVD